MIEDGNFPERERDSRSIKNRTRRRVDANNSSRRERIREINSIDDVNLIDQSDL